MVSRPHIFYFFFPYFLFSYSPNLFPWPASSPCAITPLPAVLSKADRGRQVEYASLNLKHFHRQGAQVSGDNSWWGLFPLATAVAPPFWASPWHVWLASASTSGAGCPDLSRCLPRRRTQPKRCGATAA
ncbi:hypothetical protein GQ53DRAFT_57941 [Thozetella sp. PMI_491]|nr:hypothetical protein GQ53DRAFT_57941 [Thozetella sp. PMI_491]